MSKLTVTIDGFEYEVELTLTPHCDPHCMVTVDGQELTLVVPGGQDRISELNWMIIDERPYEITYDDQLHWLRTYSGLHRLDIQDLEAKVARPRSGDGRIKAPIPGLITHILVAEGETVKAEQPLFILEAMKMENEIRAPFEGVLQEVTVSRGQTVVQNEVLAEIA